MCPETFAAPQRGEVARAGERICGVPCNLWVARDRAAQQSAAPDEADRIAQEGVAQWDHSMAIHATAVPPISAELLAAAAREAATAR